MLSLLVFLVILVFQAAINKLSEGCSRLSAYIQAFLEEDTDDVWHWERHRFRINSYVWSKHNYNGIHRLYNLASRNGTVCFGIVSIIICALQYEQEKSVLNMWMVAISVIFTFLTALADSRLSYYGDDLCKRYYQSMIEYKSHFTPSDKYEE